MGTLGCPKRLRTQLRDCSPGWPRADSGIPPGRAQHAPGILLGDGMVVRASCPGWSRLDLMRGWRILGSAVGAEEHLVKKDK